MLFLFRLKKTIKNPKLILYSIKKFKYKKNLLNIILVNYNKKNKIIK